MTVPHPGHARILLAAKEDAVREQLRTLLKRYGVDAVAGQLPAILGRLESEPSICLVVIVEAPADPTELDLLAAVRERRPDVAALLLSRNPTIEHATEAIRRGAEDFVPVPYSDDVLKKEVERILAAADLRDHLANLDQFVSTRYGFEQILSRSAAMRPVFDRAIAASRSDAPVLVIGETGTGKELLARAIHANSRRASRPFVPINCAALPADLVESELFGHRRGAFSGALSDHAGLFVRATGGTLLLDEIGELQAETQAKLLRVLQDGEVRPVGGLDGRHVDLRIIAATNRPLAELEQGAMRADLFYRLSVLLIEIPPLRERLDDLPGLIRHFLTRDDAPHHIETIEPGALELLQQYTFPGNVRELENLIENLKASVPVSQHAVRAEDVRSWFRRRGLTIDTGPAGGSLELSELETWAITEALRRTGGNKSRAARLLGVSRDTLYRKIRELRVTVGSSDYQTH